MARPAPNARNLETAGDEIGRGDPDGRGPVDPVEVVAPEVKYETGPIAILFQILFRDRIDNVVFWITMIAFAWGLRLYQPFVMFNPTSDSFDTLRLLTRFTGEAGFGLAIMIAAAVKMGVLLVVRHPVARAASALAMFLIWGFIAVSFTRSNFESSGSPVYIGFAIIWFWVMLRRMGTAVLLHKARQIINDDVR